MLNPDEEVTYGLIVGVGVVGVVYDPSDDGATIILGLLGTFPQGR